MSQPMIPLNYPVTQVEAQVAQFVEGPNPNFYDSQATVLDTVAHTDPGTTTVKFVGE